MSSRTCRLLAASALAGTMMVMGGCASTDEMKELRQMASDAAAAAQRAEQAAARAQSTADGAASQAEQAMQRAEAANACCQANTERMNRMFKKSMMK